jgi:hypothetical protein
MGYQNHVVLGVEALRQLIRASKGGVAMIGSVVAGY